MWLRGGVVEMIWSVTSLLVSGVCAICLLQPCWIIHPVTFSSFGLSSYCLNPLLTINKNGHVVYRHSPPGHVHRSLGHHQETDGHGQNQGAQRDFRHRSLDHPQKTQRQESRSHYPDQNQNQQGQHQRLETKEQGLLPAGQLHRSLGHQDLNQQNRSHDPGQRHNHEQNQRLQDLQQRPSFQRRIHDQKPLNNQQIQRQKQHEADLPQHLNHSSSEEHQIPYKYNYQNSKEQNQTFNQQNHSYSHHKDNYSHNQHQHLLNSQHHNQHNHQHLQHHHQHLQGQNLQEPTQQNYRLHSHHQNKIHNQLNEHNSRQQQHYHQDQSQDFKHQHQLSKHPINNQSQETQYHNNQYQMHDQRNQESNDTHHRHQHNQPQDQHQTLNNTHHHHHRHHNHHNLPDQNQKPNKTHHHHHRHHPPHHSQPQRRTSPYPGGINPYGHGPHCEFYGHAAPGLRTEGERLEGIEALEALPSGAWAAACVLYTGGCGIFSLTALVSVLASCLPGGEGWGRVRAVRGVAWIQAASVCLMVLALLLFPAALDTPQARRVCGPRSRLYRGGECQIGWAYMLAVMGCALAVFCPLLARYVDLRVCEPEGEVEGVGRRGRGGREMGKWI